MIVLAGKNNIAVYALNYLSKHYPDLELAIVGNQNDIGKDTWQKSFKKRAVELGYKSYDLSAISHLDFDCFLSLEFDQIIRPEKLPTDNLYNIHFSELPKYKGMYTSVWPILFGDETSGVTLHQIDAGIDTGDIYDQFSFLISNCDRAHNLYYKYIQNSQKLFLKNIEAILAGKMIASRQNQEKSSYYSKKTINFNNLLIDFCKTAWEIQRQVYAFSFRPYQLLKINGKFIAEIEILDTKSIKKAGTLLSQTELYIEVSTIDYNIRIHWDFFEEKLLSFSNCDVRDVSINLKNMCGVNDKNLLGWSPIIVAAYHGNLKVMEELLRHGADINDINAKGTSVLMYAKEFALKNKNKEFFEAVLEFGANIEHYDLQNKQLIDYLSEDQIHFLGVS